MSFARCLALLVLVTSAAPAVHQAQRARRASLPGVRAVSLGMRAPYQLAVDPTGIVHVSCAPGGVARIDLTGAMQFSEIHWETAALSITTDGNFVAGRSPGFFGYQQATWWSTQPVGWSGHFPGPGIAYGIENIPGGPVVVGSDWGEPADVRPGSGFQILPTPPTWPVGAATGISTDGSTYSGWLQSDTFSPLRAVRWVDRAPEFLDDPLGMSMAHGVSPDGGSFAGEAFDGTLWNPAVWLAAEGRVQRILRDPAGLPFDGTALGVLDGGFAFGVSDLAPKFGWIWHPGLGTSAVMRIDTWLALAGLPALHVESVQDVVRAGNSYHLALLGGLAYQSWYVQTTP